MNKLIVLVVIVGLGWLFREPLGNLVDRVKAIGPRVQTEMDMRSMEDDLITFIDNQGEPPGELARWIDRNWPPKNPGQPSSNDRYGTPYQVTRDRERNIYQLRSCGADRECYTEDDILRDLVNE